MARRKKEEIIENFLNETLDDIMSDRFGSYSKYIIQERALPDARDGLKPVQRRILYSMYIDGNTYEKPHRKSAKTVGSVMGTFHPHGDSSIYEAMVRMSQDWKINLPLIDMHGNNGSMMTRRLPCVIRRPDWQRMPICFWMISIMIRSP